MRPKIRFFRLSALACLVCLYFTARAETRQPTAEGSVGSAESAEQAILRLESERCRAMERADTLTLGRLLSADLTYVHSNGAQDSRQSLLEKLAARRIEYLSIRPERTDVRVFGGAALAAGTTLIKAKAGGETFTLHSRFTSVYIRGIDPPRGRAGEPSAAAESWKMVAYQSTRMPEE